jgi:hypothetical protein
MIYKFFNFSLILKYEVIKRDIFKIILSNNEIALNINSSLIMKIL